MVSRMAPKIVKFNNIKTTFPEFHGQFFLGHQAVRIRYQSQFSDSRNKLLKDGVSPVTHKHLHYQFLELKVAAFQAQFVGLTGVRSAKVIRLHPDGIV